MSCPYCQTTLAQSNRSYSQPYPVGQPVYSQGYRPMADGQKRGFAITAGVLIIIGGVFALIAALALFWALSWLGSYMGGYAVLFTIFAIVFMIAFPMSIIGAVACFRMKGRMWAMWG